MLRKRTTLLAALLILTAAPRLAAEDSKPEPSETMVWLRFVAAELRTLRREMLDDRVERQETRVRALEKELDQLRLARQDSEEAQSARTRDLIQVDQRLGDSAVPAEERSQLEDLRTSVAAHAQNEATASTKKEAQINGQLLRERERLESLRNLARALAPPEGSQH